MAKIVKRLLAFQDFDVANIENPKTEDDQGRTYPKEVLYGMHLTECLNEFDPKASEHLKYKACCQHIPRWKIPRELYNMNRKGNLLRHLEFKKRRGYGNQNFTECWL